ncbi:MAG: Zn-ribbon domain-containing OB-fold protein [Nocardioides sp.]
MSAAPELVYDEGIANGELRFQRCRSCETVIFYPRVLCPGCGSPDLAWERSEGRGVVYSTTTVRRRDGDHDVSLVDLDEGFRMMSTVLGEPGEVRIGERVVVDFVELQGRPAAVFRKESHR